MKQFASIATVLLTVCASALSQQLKSDVATFELTPTAPPTPALKYQLHFDDANDLLPGNAAILYLDSILLMGQDARDKASKALDAFAANDMNRFNSLADSLDNRSLIEELDLAARRSECDWESPYREMGSRTLLPHLSPLRDLGRILNVRAEREINEGKIDDALKTIRLGYELSAKIGTEPVLISGLVSIRISAMMNDCLRDIMNRPDAPNLYWAFSECPSQRSTLRTSWEGESQWWTASIPDLSRFRRGEELSADQWRAVFDEVLTLVQEPNKRTPDPVSSTSPELMRQAREQYALAHQMTVDQAARVDSIIVIGEFYFQQYENANEDIFKLRGLAYPVLLAKTAESADMVKKLIHDEPVNYFLEAIPNFHSAVWAMARADRQLAAMTAVEAIRSYAAANGGSLPARLEDISDTPVPDNPATGMSFGYGVDGDTATITDTQSEGSLTYTVRIRK